MHTPVFPVKLMIGLIVSARGEGSSPVSVAFSWSGCSMPVQLRLQSESLAHTVVLGWPCEHFEVAVLHCPGVVTGPGVPQKYTSKSHS